MYSNGPILELGAGVLHQRVAWKNVVVMALLLLTSFGPTSSAQTLPPQTSEPTDSQPTAPRTLHSFDASLIDRTVDPCHDFYKFACGSWTKANPVPGDEERVWISGQMNDRNFYLLYTELKQASVSPATPLQRQYGTFFAACMNVDQANTLGKAPLEPTLTAIQAIADKRELARFLGDQRYLGRGWFTLTVEQDERDSRKQLPTLRQAGLTLPTPDYYLSGDERQTATLIQYRSYLETVFRLLGDGPDQALAEARSVLDVETALAKDSMSRSDMRDPTKIYHPVTVAALQQIAPDFDWPVYFAGVGAPSFTTLNIEQPRYVATMAKVISAQPLPALKSYLRIHAVNPSAPYLSEPLSTASFHFFNTTLRGQAVEQPRWKRCTQLSDKVLSDAVGRDWVRQNFSPESKAAAAQVIANVRNALRDEIKSLPWMSAEAKQEALRKVDAMREKIGYPSHWRDYSTLKISSADFISDVHNVELLNQQQELRRINRPVDEALFYWTVPEADANYNEHLNDIEFPAGILQSPRYSPSVDPAVNYGGLGTLVGHEMTHGFDDIGSRYNERGDLRDWFTPSDHKAFNQMNACEVKEYSGFEAVPGLRLNGELSVGENTADNGGLRIAYKALQKVLAQQSAAAQASKLDGYTPNQRFFIGFAQSWCETRTEQFQRLRGQTDPHLPGEFRVDGTVQNFAPFGEAFGCHAGQPMMPANACHIW